MVSTKRTASVVPEGIVTFCGGGGGGGAVGVMFSAVLAGGGGGNELDGSLGSERCSFSARLRAREGAGFTASGVGAAVASAMAGAAGATCRLLMTCFTPGTEAA